MELQRRQNEFKELNALLVVIGSQPEPLDAASERARAFGITYPLVYDAERSAIDDLGLWSDQMKMPLMGYVIIDRSGRVVHRDLALSEATGAAPSNVDRILAELVKVQRKQATES